MNLDQALITFIAESRELLEDMEAALLRMEGQGEGDPETVNAVFRAAHTIKGSAGLFGLDAVVAFTHVFENVLDALRDGRLAFGGELAALFLECGDHLQGLILRVEAGELDAPPPPVEAELLKRLRAFLADEGSKKAETAPPKTQLPREKEASVRPLGGNGVQTDHWHISLRFSPDVLRHGMDPLSFIRYLGTLGQVLHVQTLSDALPALTEMDAESCYLGFEIAFASEASKAEIEGVFEFVRDSADIHILPPNSQIEEYIRLIHELPEDDLKLGEILVRCGTLTDSELTRALADQRAGEEAGAARPLGEILVESQSVQAPVVDAALDKQQQIKTQKQQETRFIRVDADRLGQLINLIGELVITNASAQLQAQRAGLSDLIEATSSMARLVEEVRDSALSLRMVQIGATFSKFQRVVRDVSRELGKDIELIITGGDTELDKTVVERIGDPLTHLVRNSMDHGIESAEVRRARGKPATGRVILNAYHDSGSIVIEISDDGGGLNRERILKKALERGLIEPGHNLSDREIYQLIFEPGFSTVDQVTNLSGRGVGMDVVRRNINELRGSIELDSEEGKGTTIRIRLPLTLAIIDGFLVGVGASSYVVPLDMVKECVELRGEDMAKSTKGYLNLRGEVLPLVRLRELFDTRETAGGPRRENVVVVGYGDMKAGLVVDALHGEYQTVIKPLGPLFSGARGIGGSTILGTGDVALILDVPLLVHVASSHEPALTA